MKLKFGIWYHTKMWHIVEIKKVSIYNLNPNIVAICNNNIWIDNCPSNQYTLPDGLKIKDAVKYFNLNHICKNCIKIVNIEDVKTYLIYHKLGIKQ